MYESVNIPDSIIVNGLVRSTRNNLGKLINNSVEKIENFWKWFGVSKVVDNEGRPYVCYHGTGKDISEFDINLGRGKNTNTGVFFSSSYNVANTYAPGIRAGNVMPVYLKMENPVIITAHDANWNKITGKSSIETPSRILKGLDNESKPIREKAKKIQLKNKLKGEFDYDDYMSTDDLARWARYEGYSSLILRNIKDRGPNGIFAGEESGKANDIFVIFDNSLVKSATGNYGEYSNSLDIRHE